ncbi:MAG: hypothetical protein Alpg2KO_07610 [Alphaproteobacteria bacterium]
MYHLQTTTWLVQNDFIGNAPLLVDFFFVLSGFVISLSFTSRIKTGSSVAKFQWRRVRRLFPLHLFTFALWIGIVLSMPYLAGGYENYNEPSEAGDFFSLFGAEIFQNMFLLHGLTEGALLFNYPSWTISVEFWTYLVFAVAVLFFRHLVWIGAIFGAAFCMMVLATNPIVDDQGAVVSAMNVTSGMKAFMRCIYGFSMGILAYRLVCWLKFRTGSGPLLALIALAIAGMVILGGTVWEVALTGIFAGIVALASRLKHDTILYAILNAKAMVWLGTISYSLYMVHSILWWILPQVLVAAMPSVFEFATINGEITAYAQLSLSGVGSLIYTIACLALLIVVSSATYYLVERPFIADPLRRRIRARRAARGRPARRRRPAPARPAPAPAAAAAKSRPATGGRKAPQRPEPEDMPPAAPITRNPAVLARQRMEAARRKVTMAEASGGMAGSGVRGKGTGLKGVPNWQADGYPDWQRGTPKRR